MMQLIETEGFFDVIDRMVVDRKASPLLKDLGLLEVGITHAGPEWCFIRPSPGFGLLIATISGGGSVVCNGRWQDAGEETAYIMAPGIPHGYRVSPKLKEWRYAWAKFEVTGKYPEIFHDEGPRLIPAASYSLGSANVGLFTEVTRGNDPQLAGIWCDLIRASLTNLVKPQAIDPRVAKMWSVVADRLDEQWEVETLAEEAHVGREHLRRLCQKDYGCSPRQRLTMLRLRRSCELLLLTDGTISAIAEDVGFSDAFAFSKAFNKAFGTPPSKYREQARATAMKSGMV